MDDKIELLKKAAEVRDQKGYAQAYDILRKVLELFGPDPDVMISLAHMEDALGLLQPDPKQTHGHNAIEWAQQAIAIRPSEASYHFTLGALFQVAVVPDYEAAAKAFRQAIELEPWHAPALGSLAALYGVPDNVVPLAEAISCCEKVLRVESTRSHWLLLSRLYGYTGRAEDSERALIKGLTEVHEVPSIHY